jgi:hypothetical protein
MVLARRNIKIFVMKRPKHMPVFSADEVWLYKMHGAVLRRTTELFGTLEWELFASR